VYSEPWSDIDEYPTEHQFSIETELTKEVSSAHLLNNFKLKVLAKREDRDDILVSSDNGYFIVHLTWSAKTELSPYPLTETFETLKELESRLRLDSESM